MTRIHTHAQSRVTRSRMQHHAYTWHFPSPHAINQCPDTCPTRLRCCTEGVTASWMHKRKRPEMTQWSGFVGNVCTKMSEMRKQLENGIHTSCKWMLASVGTFHWKQWTHQLSLNLWRLCGWKLLTWKEKHPQCLSKDFFFLFFSKLRKSQKRGISCDCKTTTLKDHRTSIKLWKVCRAMSTVL